MIEYNRKIETKKSMKKIALNFDDEPVEARSVSFEELTSILDSVINGCKNYEDLINKGFDKSALAALKILGVLPTIGVYHDQRFDVNRITIFREKMTASRWQTLGQIEG